MRYGLFYKTPALYDALLWVLYRGRPDRRFEPMVASIPEGSSVLDLCAGTPAFYVALKGRGVSYTALDINPRFVAHMKRQGIQAQCGNVLHASFPSADVVVMTSSLYHFLPDVAPIVHKMLASAKERVILLEPVRNFSDSKHSLVRRFGRWASVVDGRPPTQYFDAEGFERAMKAISPEVRLTTVSNGRDVLAVFDRPPKSLHPKNDGGS